MKIGYTVRYYAVYDSYPDIVVTAIWNMMSGNGKISTNKSNTVTYGETWNITQSEFDSMITDYKEFDWGGCHYVFSHWVDENEKVVNGTQEFNWAQINYTVSYRAVYDSYPDIVVTAIWNMLSKDGEISSTDSRNLSYGASWNITQSEFDSMITDYKEFDSGGCHYVFSHWVDENDTTVNGTQTLPWDADDYTVSYRAVYDEYSDMTVTVIWNMMSGNGNISTNESNTVAYGKSWNITKSEFDAKIANYREFDYGNDHYVFDYWVDENGTAVSTGQEFPWAEEDCTVTYTAMYNITPIEYLITLDSVTGVTGDIINFTVHVAYVNGTPVSGGKAVLTILYSSPKEALAFAEGSVLSAEDESYSTQVDGNGEAVFTNVKLGAPGIYQTVAVYTSDEGASGEGESTISILKLNTSISGEGASGKPAEKKDIPAEILDQNSNPVKKGTATLTYNGADYNGTVVEGKTVFKDVVLGNPGDYKASIKYNGNDYYSPSNSTVNIHVDILNTETSADDIGGREGEVKDIEVTIVDENGNPVKNGTATLTVDGKKYTADVVDGVATFKDVAVPLDDTVADVYYHGNEYYNASSTTFLITVESEQDNNETQNETAPDSLAKAVDSRATGNPIFALLLVIVALVFNGTYRRKK